MYSVVLGWEEDMVVDGEDARMQLQVPNAGCRGKFTRSHDWYVLDLGIILSLEHV